jgi:hypothetical protein
MPPALLPGAPSPPTDGFAIAGFVLGLLGGVLLSVIFSLVALSRIKHRGGGGRGLAIAGLALSGLWVLAFAGVATVATVANLQEPSRNESGQVTEGGSVDGEELRVGDCLRDKPTEAGVTSFTVVPCSEPHHGQVFSVSELEAGPYPGVDTVTARADKLCADAETALILEQLPDSAEVIYLYPTAVSWSGDRSVQCLVSLGDDPITGSVVQGAADGA